MSYCRKRIGDFGDCDQYVISQVDDGLVCIDCTLIGDGHIGSKWFHADSPEAMIDHLERHRAKGEIVSARALELLREEISA